MRTLLLALALATQLPSPAADACGGYGALPPKMFVIGPLILVDGTHDVQQLDITPAAVTDAERIWAANPPFAPALDPDQLRATRVADDVVLLTAFTAGHVTTYVKWGDAAPAGGYEGAPKGVVKVDGRRFAVLVDRAGTVRPIRI